MPSCFLSALQPCTNSAYSLGPERHFVPSHRHQLAPGRPQCSCSSSPPPSSPSPSDTGEAPPSPPPRQARSIPPLPRRPLSATRARMALSVCRGPICALAACVRPALHVFAPTRRTESFGLVGFQPRPLRISAPCEEAAAAVAGTAAPAAASPSLPPSCLPAWTRRP